MTEIKKEMTSEEILSNAQKSLENRDMRAAYGWMKQGFEKDYDYKPMYEFGTAFFKAVEAEKEEELMGMACEQFDEVESFFNLGYHFVGVEEFHLAKPFLQKTLAMNPEHMNASYELSLAYSSRFQVKEALEVLEKSAFQSDFWSYLRYCQCLLWNNQTEGIDDFIHEMRHVLAKEEENENVIFAKEKLYELEMMKKRFMALKKEKRDLNHIRDWHFIQHGTAVLSYFEEDLASTGGRFVSLSGNHEQVKRLIEHVLSYLKTMKKPFDKILTLDEDRDSNILAEVFSALSNKPLDVLRESNVNDENTLIVVSDAMLLNGIMDLFKIQSNQMIFAFNLNWYHSSMLVPDVAGVMTQFYSFPWSGEGMKVDPKTQDVVRMEKDTREPSIIAKEIASLTLSEDTQEENKATFTPNLNFYKKHKKFLTGGKFHPYKRLSFTVESPVPSSYFN